MRDNGSENNWMPEPTDDPDVERANRVETLDRMIALLERFRDNPELIHVAFIGIGHVHQPHPEEPPHLDTNICSIGMPALLAAYVPPMVEDAVNRLLIAAERRQAWHQQQN